MTVDRAIFVVTRPAPDHARLMQALRDRRREAIHSPGFRLEQYPDEVLDQRLNCLPAFDLVIVTSPVAARLIAGRPLPAGLRNTRFIAPGSGTVSILEGAGIAAARPEKGGTSEDILAMVESNARPDRVAIVGAPGGRTLLAREFSRRGAEVVPVHLYERVPMKPHCELVTALRRSSPLVVLISSARAFETILEGLPQELRAGWLDAVFVVSSTRIAELCGRAGVRRIRVAPGASDEAMLPTALAEDLP